MIKRFKPVIILGSVALVLGLALWILVAFVLPKAEEGGESGEAVIPTIELMKADLTGAEYLEIKNDFDDYKLIKRAKEEYYVEGKEDLVINSESVVDLLTQIGSLTANKKVMASPDDEKLEEYGLKNPHASVTVKNKSDVYQFKFGITSATGSYYMQMSGDEAVYLVNSSIPDIVMVSRHQFYIDTITSYTDSIAEQGKLTDIVIAGKNRKETVVITANDDLAEDEVGTAYIITSPIQHSLSSLMIEDITGLLSSLAGSSIVSDSTDEATLKKYGLADPVSTFSAVMDGKKETIYFGNVNDLGMQYCYAKGGKFVHTVDAESAAPLTALLVDFCEDMLYTRAADTLSGIKIIGREKTYNITIGEKDEAGDMDVTINKRKVDSDLFSDFYMHLFSISIIGMDEEPKDEEPLVRVEYTVKETGKVEVMEFYPINELRCRCVLNGSGRFVVNTLNVDLILENAQHLYDGEKIELEYF